MIGLISLETFIQRKKRKESVKFVFKMRHSKEKVTDSVWHLGWVKENQAKKWTFAVTLAQRSNWSCLNTWDKIDKCAAENQGEIQTNISL